MTAIPGWTRSPRALAGPAAALALVPKADPGDVLNVSYYDETQEALRDARWGYD